MTRNDLSGARWRKSSYSDGQANCVEVTAVNRRVAVRDSKSADGRRLSFPQDAWQQFVARVVVR
jgi:hypothetical protein